MSDFLSQQQCDELVNGQTYNGEYVPTDQDLADMAEAWGSDEPFEGDENLFCANCGHVELVGSAQSPDDSLCCDCYKYNNDNDDYEETEADTYQDHSYYDDFDQPEWMEWNKGGRKAPFFYSYYINIYILVYALQV